DRRAPGDLAGIGAGAAYRRPGARAAGRLRRSGRMMFGAFERMMALRYLRSRRQESFISVIAGFSLLGIALGVATLIIVMAVMNGFRQELLGRILGINGHLTVYGASGGIEHYQDVAEQLRRIGGVELVVPQIQSQAIVTAGDTARGAVVRGVAPSELLQRRLIADNIVAGSADAFLAGEGVLLGRRLGEGLGRRPGDDLTLLSPQGNTTAIGTLPRVKSYPI